MVTLGLDPAVNKVGFQGSNIYKNKTFNYTMYCPNYAEDRKWEGDLVALVFLQMPFRVMARELCFPPFLVVHCRIN